MSNLKYQTPEDRWKLVPDIDRSGEEQGDRYDWKQGYACALRDHAAPLEMQVDNFGNVLHDERGVDLAFCNAILTHGGARFDVLHNIIVSLHESGKYKSIERIMDLALGTYNRGYVRSVLISVKPIKEVVSKEKWEQVVDFLRQSREGVGSSPQPDK